MSESLENIRGRLADALSAVDSTDAVEQLRVEFLGKKGAITLQLKELGSLPADARKAAGQAINELKQFAQAEIDARRESLLDSEGAGVVVDELVKPRDVAMAELRKD